MQLYLLDEKKITKLGLPIKPEGSFSLVYKPENAPVKKNVTIEASENVWILRSNGEVNVLKDGVVVSGVPLSKYGYYYLKVQGYDAKAILLSMPDIEKDYYQLSTKFEEITIGKDASNAICYQHDLVADLHAKIYREDGIWYIKENDSESISYLNDIRITKNKLKTGDIIHIYGLKIIWVTHFLYVYNPQNKVTINSQILTKYEEVLVDNTQFEPLLEEELNIELYKPDDYFFHTPSLKNKIEHKTIKIDTPPGNQGPDDTPVILTMGSSITMIGSAFMSGFTILMVLGNGNKPLLAIIPSIVMLVALIIGSLFLPQLMRKYQRKRAAKKEKIRQQKYTEYLQTKVKEINEIITNQSRTMHENNPGLRESYGIVFSNSQSKWSKEISDEDFLTVRLGTGNVAASLDIKAPEESFSLDDDNLKEQAIAVSHKEYLLKNVPITFSFLENKITAMINNNIFEQDYINGLILQLTAFHSAADLKLVFLINDPNVSNWEYAKFLPHSLNDNKSIRFFATTESEIRTVCSYLEEEYHYRKDNSKSSYQDDIRIKKGEEYKRFKPYYLIITNDFLTIKNISVIDKILNSSDNLGMSILISEKSIKRLPHQSNVFLQIMEPESFILKKDLNHKLRFIPEYDGSLDMRNAGVQLANIPLQPSNASSTLPTTVTFLEMYNVSRIEQFNVSNNWKANDPTLSLQAMVGVNTNGEGFMLDLHEKFHGPHGLIAGATGSGKSEFIITYILSMALNYHPDEVQFVIIDYKGGGLAGAFENRHTGIKLPHLVGTITNLDLAEMNRSLVSINSELKRRQQLFNEVRNKLGESTIDIYKYQMYYRQGLVKEPISHLFIISDEFAELKAQQPEFMSELISAARIGRSLGIHLILATQKPSGVVNDQIWSNARFKVCLKVQDRSDSMEMLKKPDAASIKETGRFYLQVGYDEFFDIGQSGWAGANYIPTNRITKKQDDSINFVNNTGFIYKSINNPENIEFVSEKGDQLTNLVKYIVGVANKEHFETKQLWQNIIPNEIFISNLKEKYAYVRTPYLINPIIGEYDNPTAQSQGLLTLDITNRGNTLIYGMSGSGKENLLSTIIYSSVINHTPSEVNFYIIDLGSETLKIYNEMAHVGDVCTIDETEKIENLFSLIIKEMNRRRMLFAQYNGSYINYCKLSGKAECSIIIVINNYEVFTDAYNKYTEMLGTICRDSAKYGIYFIITATHSNKIRAKVADSFNNKICLRMSNDSDYRDILGAPRGLIPKNNFGRGIINMENGVFEFQTAFIHIPKEINTVIKRAIMTFEKYTNQALAIPVLPEKVTLNMVENYMKDVTGVPIGYDAEQKGVYLHDFTKSTINVITATDIEEKTGFINALIRLLKKDNNLNLKVIDLLDILKEENIGIKVFNENFDSIMENINNELLQEKVSLKKNLYVFVGIGELKKKLISSGITIYNSIFANSSSYKNSYFIFIDSSSSYKTIMSETWASMVIDKRVGIWLGEDVDTQFAITFLKLTSDEKKLKFSDIGFVAKKHSHVIIKKVVE